jgi:hypothetical protein
MDHYIDTKSAIVELALDVAFPTFDELSELQQELLITDVLQMCEDENLLAQQAVETLEGRLGDMPLEGYTKCLEVVFLRREAKS